MSAGRARAAALAEPLRAAALAAEPRAATRNAAAEGLGGEVRGPAVLCQ